MTSTSPPSKHIPVEIFSGILSFASTSTLAACCRASFGLLSLAGPLLYKDIVLDSDTDVHKMLYSRDPDLDSSRLRPFLSFDPRTTLTLTHVHTDADDLLTRLEGYRPPSVYLRNERPTILPPHLIDTLEIPSSGKFYIPGGQGMETHFDFQLPFLHPRRIVFYEPVEAHFAEGQPLGVPVLYAKARVVVGKSVLREVVMENCIQVVEPRSIYIPESEIPHPVKLILDLRVGRLMDRGNIERAFVGLQEPVAEEFEIWVRDVKEKRAMERMVGGKGWSLRGGELVKVVELE